MRATDLIGVNMTIGGVNALTPGDSAGAPGARQACWNNVTGSVTLSAGTVTNQNGAAVPGLAVSLSTANTFSRRVTGTVNDTKLFGDVIDHFPERGPTRIAVTGIPYAAYNVYFYELDSELGNGAANTRGGYFAITNGVADAPQMRYMKNQDDAFAELARVDGSGNGYVFSSTASVAPTGSWAQVQGGNAVVFYGLTNSGFTALVGTFGGSASYKDPLGRCVTNGNTVARLKFAGFQIQEVGASEPGCAPVSLASPDGRLALTFAVSNFDGTAACPVYRVERDGRALIGCSRLGLTFGSGLLRAGLTLVDQSTSASNAVWRPVYGERSEVTEAFNQVEVTLQEAAAPGRRLQLTFRAYDEGVAFRYTIPEQAGLDGVSNLTEQTEFRFDGDYPAWTTSSAQGLYSANTVSGVPAGCERPLPVRLAPDLYAALGEAGLVDYARMKFAPLSGRANSLVSTLDGPVNGPLPLTTPWRFVLVGESPGRLLENDALVLNLNAPCAVTNTGWIKPGKVIREVTVSTAGGLACVDFAVKHRLQYIEYDAGWYGPETTTLDATRPKAGLDLQRVIDYANSNGVGVILYVNWLAMTNQLEILPPLYQGWGVKGVKYGFVGPNSAVGRQGPVSIVNRAVRLCAENRLVVDVHDELRPTGLSRTYPNWLTAEGILGDEGTPTVSQDLVSLFSRQLAGGADHTFCYFDRRVADSWSCACQLAKAVCFYSPMQFLYWYDSPTNAPGYVSGGNCKITEEPELEFFDCVPAVWDETRVLQGSIGEYAVIARRSGEDWYVGLMNAGETRDFAVPLDFLTPGVEYIETVYTHDAALKTRTQVRLERWLADASGTNVLTLGASDGAAIRLTPACPPRVQSLGFVPEGFGLTLTGHPGSVYSLYASPSLSLPLSEWTPLARTNLITVSPFTLIDEGVGDQPQQFYRFTSP